MKPKFTIVISPSNEVEVDIQKSVYCPIGSVYVMPDKDRPLLTHLKTVYEAEKERSEWIRRYDNVLNGLNYWKQKAINQPS